MCEIEARYEAYKEQAEAEVKRLKDTVARLNRMLESVRPHTCNNKDCDKREYARICDCGKIIN